MADSNGPYTTKTPAFGPVDDIDALGASSSTKDDTDSVLSPQRLSVLRQRPLKQSNPSEPQQRSATQDIYLGSYFRRSTPRGSGDIRAAPSPRESTSHLQLEPLLDGINSDLETYGAEELRDGFFDASFYRPPQINHDDLMHKALMTLPEGYQKSHPLSLREFLPQHLREVRTFLRQVTTSRAGIKLMKTFLGFFITYVICLIPASRDWLGRYNYIMVISAIINHPGRPIGSQIDGAFMTILGAVAGLGWGSLALYVSTSTSTAQLGYGGVLAAFLVLFTAVIGWLRCVLIRFYQAILSAGFAIFYTCLANTSQDVGWVKVFDYGIPWALGQAVCLLVSILVFPEAGSRAISLAFHDALEAVKLGLYLPREDSQLMKRKLASQFINISQAVRDFTIDCTISRFSPDDMREARNMIQSVIRAIMSIRPDTQLFHVLNEAESQLLSGTINDWPQEGCHSKNKHVMKYICSTLRGPVRELNDAMLESVRQADLTVMEIGGLYSSNESPKLSQAVSRLRAAMDTFDAADSIIVADPNLPSTYVKSTDVMDLFLFVHPVRQTADRVDAFVWKVLQMQENSTGWHVRIPSHPFTKALMRVNAQVRHDRGGLTAAFYFRGKRQLDRTMADLQSVAYVPAARQDPASNDQPVDGEYQQEKEVVSEKRSTLRYRLWQVLHRLQGFESRFAFKVCLVTTLISIPAWLPQSRNWWNNNESWWAVVTVWVMMHPRVGGTFQDLATRTFCAALGALWGGLAYAAGGGNPYVMAAFAAIYMLPMLYRFTQSTHPRSGIIGCLSFTVVSLSAYTSHGQPSIITIAWTRGLAFVVGLISALIVNWILWPFIARHELRKSLSSMLLHSAILYRGVIAKYIYYTAGEGPGPEDIARSEMLEGRLREGFLRMRQLMELTRHEMRLRAPFNPLPYSALISACESFFEHLVQVRQSALYFQPTMLASDPELISSLTAPRRDAVAVILLNLYILACALRADRPIPRYLPSAAAARRKLLDRMEIVEAEMTRKMEGHSHEERKGRRWADVYAYAYSGALTDIVENLGELRKFTREVVGEVEWESDILGGPDEGGGEGEGHVSQGKG